MDYGLVLAGGGMRGAYQIGVWRALTEMKIRITAVAGASIGAINGAMFVQGDYKKAEQFWREIKPDDIIAPIITDSGEMRDIIKEGIVDMSPLEKLLSGVVDERKLRKSPIDFGIAAFSLNKKTGISKFKSEIPKGKIVDYLMASACIPGVKARKVGDDTFMDGGVSNNMPVDMLAARGMNNLICVDIKGIGICKDIDLSGKNVIEIVFDKPETGVAEVDSKGIDLSIKAGYIDCLRAFGRVEGDKYAFMSKDYRTVTGMYSKELILSLETAAEIFGMDVRSIYIFDELVKSTLNAYRKYEAAMDSNSGTLEKIRNLGDRAVTAHLVKNGGDSLGGSLFAACKRAASAIIYFSREI